MMGERSAIIAMSHLMRLCRSFSTMLIGCLASQAKSVNRKTIFTARLRGADLPPCGKPWISKRNGSSAPLRRRPPLALPVDQREQAQEWPG